MDRTNDSVNKFNRKRIFNIFVNLALIAVCVVVAYYLSNYMFTTIQIKGPSMEHTLEDSDYVIIYKPGNYRVGDVVVFNSHLEGVDSNGDPYERHFVKRIIGLEGDKIELILEEDGVYRFYRNGEKIDESYLSEGKEYDNDKNIYEESPLLNGGYTVADGEFFYLGDNRSNSTDCRTSDCGNLSDIDGRVILKYENEDGVKNIGVIKRAS